MLLTLLATPAFAQDIDNATCSGQDPDWTMGIAQKTATLDYLRTSDMTLALETVAEGRDWPKGYTFVGRGDTAIVIFEAPQTDGASAVRILTQRGETPLLLIGHCRPN